MALSEQDSNIRVADVPRVDWQSEMHCVELVDSGALNQQKLDEYFFPEETADEAERKGALKVARAICRACDVQPDCLFTELSDTLKIRQDSPYEAEDPAKSTIVSDTKSGVYGGADGNERARILMQHNYDLEAIRNNIGTIVPDLNSDLYSKKYHSKAKGSA